MIIATFNVNSVRMRLGILSNWLKELKPDFLFMQETKTQNVNFPESAFAELGYKSFYNGEKSYNGVAAIVKNNLEVKSVNFGFNDGLENNFDTRVLVLEYDNLIILNTYVPQGKEITHSDYEVKKGFLRRVKNLVNKYQDKLFLWLGDINVAPNNIDVTHPENKRNHVCACSEIREVFSDAKGNLIDIQRKFDSKPGIYTFFDYRVKDAVKRNIGWRIDLMLANEKLADVALSCKSDVRLRELEKPSDHVPLIAEYKI